MPRRPRANPVRELARLVRTSGQDAAGEKTRALRELVGRARLPAAELPALQDLLLFLRAHPDDAAVFQAAGAALARLRAWAPRRPPAVFEETGLPGSVSGDAWGFALLRRLTRLHPGTLELDWDALEDPGPLQAAVVRVLAGAEVPGLDDIRLEWDDWMAAARARPGQTDLEVLLELFAGAPGSASEREARYDACALPVRWRHENPGGARAELLWPCPRPVPLDGPPPQAPTLAPLLRRAPSFRRLAPAEGERFLDLATSVLATRRSEIRPLSHGSAHDVTWVEAGRGLAVVLVGVGPEEREALEALYTMLLVRNGVPIAYGPASITAGCTEMGLQLFPEFRGRETRWLYAQTLRALHHVLGSRHFFLTAYGVGAGNPEALQAGSFWFYRRLGFRPASAEVERLARAEERRFARSPGARSTLATLKRLAETSVHLDLSRGRWHPLPLGPVGLAVTRRIVGVHGGDRARAAREDARLVARALGGRAGLPSATLALLAPVLALDPALARRPRVERAALRAYVRAKGAPSEREADAHLRAAPGFLAALRKAAEPSG